MVNSNRSGEGACKHLTHWHQLVRSEIPKDREVVDLENRIVAARGGNLGHVKLQRTDRLRCVQSEELLEQLAPAPGLSRVHQ